VRSFTAHFLSLHSDMLPPALLLALLVPLVAAQTPAGYTRLSVNLASPSSTWIQETTGGSLTSCAASCDLVPACRGFLYFSGGLAVKRCRTLARASADVTTPTSTFASYLKDDTANFKLVATSGSRFANSLLLSDIVFSSTVTSRAQCFAACESAPNCLAVYHYKIGANVWKCNGLSSASYSFISTGLEGNSYAKASAVPTVLGYTLEAQGATHTNLGNTLRFAASFVPTALLEEIRVSSLAACAAECNKKFTCRGAVFYRLTREWSCRLLATLEADGKLLGETSQVIYSISRDVMPTSTTTTTTTTTAGASYPGAVFQVTVSPSLAGAIGFYAQTATKEYGKVCKLLTPRKRS
jgi:hypothetical protein